MQLLTTIFVSAVAILLWTQPGAAAFVLSPVADQCVPSLNYPYIVNCTSPRWAPGGYVIDICLQYNGAVNTLCSLRWGPCTAWCQLSGRGACVGALSIKGFTTQYTNGGTASNADKISSLLCLPRAQPVNWRVGAANFAPADPTFTALCALMRDNRAVTCTNISIASAAGAPELDHCLQKGSTFCDKQLGPVVCALLGYGALKSYSVAAASSSQYFDLSTCSTGCYVFSSLVCYVRIFATESRSLSAESTQSRSRSLTNSSAASPTLSRSRDTWSALLSGTHSINITASGSQNTKSTSRTVSQSQSGSAPVERPLTASEFVGYATGVDQGTATQLLVAGNVGTAIAGAVLTAAGSKQASMSQLVSAASCMSLSEVADSFPVPDTGSLLPALPELFEPDERDVTGASDAAAMLVTNLIVVILLFVMSVTYGAASSATRSLPEKLVTGLFSIAVSFLGPTMFGAGVTLLRYPFTLPTNTRVVGAVTVLAVLGVLAATFAACRVPIVRKVGLGVPEVAVGFRERLQYHWALFYDAARDGEAWHVRLLVFEDLGVAYVIALLSSLYPGRQAVCVGLGVAVVVVALAHVVYLAAVRPYRERLKAVLAFANGVIVAAVAVLAQVTLSQPGATSNFDSPVVFALAAAMVAANCFFFVQTFVLAVHGLYEAVMRPAAPPSEALRRKGHDDEAFAVVEEDPINPDALGIEETMVPLVSPLQALAHAARPPAQLRVLPPSNPIAKL